MKFWRARLDDPCFVYVIQGDAGTPFKVGVAKDVRSRMATFQTASAYTLRLLYVLPGAHELERRLHKHKKLQPYRLRGEWFSPDCADEAFPWLQQLAESAIDAYNDSGRFPELSTRDEWYMPIEGPDPDAVKVTFVEPEPNTVRFARPEDQERTPGAQVPAPMRALLRHDANTQPQGICGPWWPACSALSPPRDHRT